MDIKVGDTVAVIGVGPIGLMFVRLATLRGARVVAIDFSDYRLEQSKKIRSGLDNKCSRFKSSGSSKEVNRGRQGRRLSNRSKLVFLRHGRMQLTW